MTTIVVTKNEIASDSQATLGNTVVASKCPKVFRIEDGWMGAAGSLHDVRILQAFFDGRVEGLPENLNCVALALPDKGKPHIITVSNGAMIMDDIEGNYYTIGSGSEFAWAALDAGCDAKKAVQIAIGRDCYSGGRVVVKKRGAKK